jgi:tetratricopeptide (TPR) repeat protein
MWRTSRWVPAVVAGLLTVILAGCSSGSGKSASPSTTTTSTSSGSVAGLLAKALRAHVQGKLDDAVRDYNAVIAADPNNKFAHYNLGLIHQIRKQTSDAEKEYRLALSVDPRYVPALYNLAILRSLDGDTAGAIELDRRAIAGSPRYAAAHFNLGLLLLKAGRNAEGNREIAAAIKLDPTLANRAIQQGASGATP